MWEIKKFRDFIKLNRGFDLPNEKMIAGEFPVIASTTIKGFHNQFKVNHPCVVTGRSGSLGTVQYITSDCWPLNTSLYVKDFKGNFPKYVYYYLQLMHLEMYNSGAGVPTLNQNHLHNVKVKIHKLPAQKKIAGILSVYDELIDENNRRIKLLEQATQQIYKEWFVRLRFPGHEATNFIKGIPEGWEVKNITAISDITDGTHDTPKPTDKGYYLITGKHIINDTIDFSGAYFIDEKDHINISKRSGLQKGNILFSNIGTIGSTCIIGENNDFSVKNVIIVKPFDNEGTCYLYCLLKNSTSQEVFKQQASGSSQQFISLGFMRKYKILIPNRKILKRFSLLVEPILNEKSVLNTKNQNLIKQRELLLPRLMSGEFII